MPTPGYTPQFYIAPLGRFFWCFGKVDHACCHGYPLSEFFISGYLRRERGLRSQESERDREKERRHYGENSWALIFAKYESILSRSYEYREYEVALQASVVKQSFISRWCQRSKNFATRCVVSYQRRLGTSPSSHLTERMKVSQTVSCMPNVCETTLTDGRTGECVFQISSL